MSMPFYVSPEQLMKDRADFARKGIARGRSVVAVQYADGILFVSENPSQALHKVSEIYDRIAFAAVGRYNEFENLRIAGVRLADMRGYAYDRRDVTGRGLANAYAQTLGTIFSSGGEKPYEVEIFVAEVGDAAAEDQIYRLTYDGQVADEHGFAVMGGADRRGGRRTSRSTTARAPRSRTRSAWRWRRSARSTTTRASRRPGDPGRRTSRSPSSTAPAPSRASSSGSSAAARRAAGRARPGHAGRPGRRGRDHAQARPGAGPGRPGGPDRPGERRRPRRWRTRSPASRPSPRRSHPPAGRPPPSPSPPTRSSRRHPPSPARPRRSPAHLPAVWSPTAANVPILLRLVTNPQATSRRSGSRSAVPSTGRAARGFRRHPAAQTSRHAHTREPGPADPRRGTPGGLPTGRATACSARCGRD